MTLDRLDTFSASCLLDSRVNAPVTANNLAKLRTWARFEDYASLSGGGLIAVNNPWATSWPEPNAGQWNSVVKTYPNCSEGVDASVKSWLSDVPAIVANLQSDGPWSAWQQQPILCQIGYWIHGVHCDSVYSGLIGSSVSTPTSGSPNPQWGCPNLGAGSTSPPPSPPPPYYQPPPSSSAPVLAMALIFGGGAALVGWDLYAHKGLRRQIGTGERRAVQWTRSL